MKTNTLKKLLILIFTPLFFIKLSSCNDVIISLGEEVEFVSLNATGEEIPVATQRIINNTVDFFIPNEILNPDGQEFVDWVVKREGMAPEPFDFNNVGNVRRVYAQFSADETISFNLSVRILDPAETEDDQDIMEPLLNISTTVTSGEAPITIQEILYSFDRDVEPMSFRNLSWYYMDENNNPDFTRPVRETRFRFVELRQFKEENGGNGLSVVGVNHIIPREFVIMTGEGRISPSALPDGQDGNPIYDYNFENRDGSFGSWKYTFIIPYGDLIIRRLNIGLLASPGQIVSQGLEIGGFVLREYEIDEAHRTTGRIIREEGFAPEELNSHFTDAHMGNSRLVLEATWRIRGATVTIHMIDSDGMVLPGVIDGLYEGQTFDVRTGGQNPIREQLMGLSTGAVDIVEVMIDPRNEFQFKHWEIWVSDGQNPPTPTPFTISRDSDNHVPGNTFYVYLVGVWEPKEHEVEVIGIGENPISIWVPWNTSIEDALENNFGDRQKAGHTFDVWREYGTNNIISNSGRLMPAEKIIVQAEWDLILSELIITSRSPNEMIDGNIFDRHEWYPMNRKFGYFDNIQDILDEFRENYEITRQGHTFGNWRIVQGNQSIDLEHDMLMQGRNIQVYVLWNVISFSVNIELYSDDEEYFAVIERDFLYIEYGDPLWQHLFAIPIMREAPVTPLEWIITKLGNNSYPERRYDIDGIMEVTMPAYNILIRLRLPRIETGETPPPTSTIYIECTEFGTSSDNLAIVGNDVSTSIVNNVRTLNGMRETHTVARIEILNAENNGLITLVSFEDMNEEWRFEMPAHDIIVRIYWNVNVFQVTFDFPWLNARNIEVLGYNEPIFVAWGQPIAPAVEGITMTRFGYEFKYFTLGGDKLSDKTMGTSVAALRSEWKEKILEIEVLLEQIGPTTGVSTLNVQLIEFRQGLPLAQLIEMLENNRIGNNDIVSFPSNTHNLNFELGYYVTRDGLLERLDSIIFISSHERTLITFESDVDPRVIDRRESFEVSIYIEHSVTCLLSYLNERPFLGFFNQNTGLFFGTLGYDHPEGGTFRGWRMDARTGPQLVENVAMFTSPRTFVAYWEVLGRIIIEGGNAMFFQEDNIGNIGTTNVMTLTGIMPGANIINALSSFLNAINGLTGLPTVNHGAFSARFYNGHPVRVMSGRQIIGFAIGNSNVNVLHDPTRVNWAIPALDPEVTVRAIVINYTTGINWQGSNVNSERPDGGIEQGFRITTSINNANQAGNTRDIVIPTFLNGRRVTEMNENFIPDFSFVDSIFLPRYLTVANPLARSGMNHGFMTIDLTNMPWLRALPTNFARSGLAGAATNRFYVIINPISALTTIARDSFQSLEWNPITMNLNLVDFALFNPSNISWWNQRNNFVWRAGTFNRTLNGVAGIPGW